MNLNPLLRALVIALCATHVVNSFPSDLVTETKHSSSGQVSIVTSSFGGGGVQQSGEQDQSGSGGVPTRQRADQRGILCRIVDTANGTVLKNHPCPPNSSCTEKQPATSADVETFHCSTTIAHRPSLLRTDGPLSLLITCRVINVETNRTELDIECPPGSTCTKMDHVLSHQDNGSEIFHCTHATTTLEPAAARNHTMGQLPTRCRVVNKDTNATLLDVQCPAGSTCDEFDKKNSDADTEIYLCSSTKQQQQQQQQVQPVRQPGFAQPGAAAGSQQQPKRCRVVDKERQEVFLNEECPSGSSCELFDQIHSNNRTDVFLCTEPMEVGCVWCGYCLRLDRLCCSDKQW